MHGAAAAGAHAQAAAPDPYRDAFTSERWCDDSGTACWRSPRESDWFNGVRFIAEFDLRFVYQGGRNRIDLPSLIALPKLAVEANIYRSWVAAQIAISAPGRIAVDSRSELRGLLRDTASASVASEGGWSFGASFLDSSIALGRGRVYYDLREFAVQPCSHAAEEFEIVQEDAWKLQRDSANSSFQEARSPAERLDRARFLEEIVKRQDSLREQSRRTRRCISGTQRRDSYWFVALQPVSTLRANLKGRRTAEAQP
jgi:hypothetical protein